MHNKKYFNELGNFKLRYFVNSPKFNRNINSNTYVDTYSRYKTFLEFKELPKAHKSIMFKGLSIPPYVSIVNDDKKFGFFKINYKETHTEHGIVFKTNINNYFVYDKIKNSVRSMEKGSFYEFVENMKELNLLKNTPFEWLEQALTIMEKDGTKNLFIPLLLDKRVQKSIMVGTIRSLKELKKRGMSMYGLKKIGFDNLVKALSFKKLSDDPTLFKRSERIGETLSGVKFNFSNINYSSSDYSSDNSIYRYDSLKSAFMILKQSNNPERDYKYLLPFLSFKFRRELSEQCMLLGEKINLSWSEKRLMETHNLFSQRITEIKSMFHDNTVLKYKEDPFSDLNRNFKLLRTSNEYLFEGTEMRHCLFSNDYFSKSKRKECFILTYNNGEVRGTAQISISRFKSKIGDISVYQKESFNFIEYVESVENDEPVFNTIAYKVSQFYSIGNSSLSQHCHIELKQLLSNRLVREWVKDLYFNKLDFELIPRKRYKYNVEPIELFENQLEDAFNF